MKTSDYLLTIEIIPLCFNALHVVISVGLINLCRITYDKQIQVQILKDKDGETIVYDTVVQKVT